MKKERKTNIELLRIIAILLIISFHYVYKSGYVFENLTVNSFIVKVFYMFGELGVNLFILITGYFMVKSKFSMKKLVCLILEVEFYYLLSNFIAIKIGIKTFTGTFGDYFSLFFPVIRRRYWFMTAYVLVYILIPYLNILIHNMNQKTYKKFLATLLLLWSVIPTIFGVFYNSTEDDRILYYSRFIWLIIMYFVGAYIRLHSINVFSKISNAIIGAIVIFGIMLMSILIIYQFRNIFGKLGTTEIAYFWRPNTIPMFILSISIFEIFLKLKINGNIIINKLASTTLGIYLIHDGILNQYIWNNIFSSLEHLNSKYSIIYILETTIIIFIIGAIIDLIRQWIEKNTIKKVLNSKFYERLYNKVTKLSSKL